MKSSMTRKQHWVPRFYLKSFADADGKLRVYRAESDSFFVASAENVCAKRDLYEVGRSIQAKEGDGRYFAQNFIEEKLSRVEDRLASHYMQLIESLENGNLAGRRYDDGKLTVCCLASNLIVRHPESLYLDNEQALKLSVWLKESGFLSGDDLITLEAEDWRGDYLALTNLAIRATSLFSGDNAVPFFKICKAFAEKSFYVLEAPIWAKFITSSMPLYIAGPQDDTYDFDFAYMPLSDKFAACFSSSRNVPVCRKIHHSEVAFCNERLLLGSPYWSEAIARTTGSLDLAVRGWKCRRVKF